MSASKEAQEERTNRLDQIIRIKVQNPNLNKRELVQIVEKQWGVSNRVAYKYLEEIDKELSKIEDHDLMRRRNLLLAKTYDIYTKARESEQYHICLGCLKVERDLLGLNKVTVFAQQVLDNSKTENNTQINVQQNIMDVQDIDDERIKALIYEIQESGISLGTAKKRLTPEAN
jgi:hypothetical protein